HFRYWKDDGDKNARVSLAPFWPKWKEEKAEPAATGSDAGAAVKVRWTNAAKADRGVLQIRDRNEQLVHLAEIPEGKLAAGSQEYDWDKKYREDVLNSKLEGKFLDDSGETTPENAPYSYKVTTFVLKLDDQSLKIKWSIKNATDLENGLIEIVDGNDKRVFLKALPKGKLSAGDKEIDWDGKYTPGITNSDGKEEITPKDMPYRVQIQAHRAPNKEKGLALAAMHTEVRIFVHPKTHLPKDPAYDPLKAEASLVLGLGPLVPGTPPAEGDGIKWYQYRLAECGFHPGPVNGSDSDHFKTAMREFQRSVPKKKTGAKYERLTVTGAMSADTKDAIKAMTDAHRRPWFGNPDDGKKDLDHKDEAGKNAINERLKDRSKDLMVWVDARHYYTTTGNGNNRPMITGTIGDYHGDMQVGDKLVEDYDGKIIPRPWIPVQADLEILSKSKNLKDEDPGRTDKETRKTMRSILGPIRVDWTFDEIGPDLSTIDTTKYDAARVRTREFVGWALNRYKKNHERKDTGRKAFYTNCPGGANPDDLSGASNFGGIRPDNLDDYYKKVFGFDDGTKDLSLAPWRAVPLDASQSVATVLHDHLAAAQTDEASNLFEPLIGVSGVYFRPSRVGGDGFRLRAEVQFTKYTDYEFPNLEVLAARYPLLPQAHTAKFRLWRKSSIRGYLRWTTRNNIGHIAGMRESYHSAHVHFADEKREATVPTYRPTDLVNTGNIADYNKYKKIVADRVNQPYHKNNRNLMVLNNDYSFPWYNETSLGWPWPSEPDAAFRKVKDLVSWVERDTWARIQEGLILDMIKRIEEKDGRLRGHLLAHFEDTRTVYTEKYICKNCDKSFWYLERDAAGGANENRRCACGGKMRRTGKCDGRYRCANGHGPFNGADDTFPGGGKFNGRRCPTCNDPSLNCVSTVQTEARQAPRMVPTGTRTIVSYGIGDAGGGTWLLKNFAAWEWAHEVGHHRHLEHSADAPVGSRSAEKDKLHDSQRNTGVDWSIEGVPSVLNQRWDRCCIMSYVDCSTGYSDPDIGGSDHTYFCGKCVLRNRGWKVEGISRGPAIAPSLPEIGVAPGSRDWGEVAVKKQKDEKLTVSNPGAARLEVNKTKIGGRNPDKFTIASGGAPFNVDPGATHDIEIRFKPTSAGASRATLTLSSNVDPSAFPGRNPLNADLEGTGKDLPDITAAPASHNFGNVASGAHGDITITVTNPGTA
ncbi:MAG: choice-of-anchor D domain-containing protein, partial [Deltaproteobacteria bacterium]|nr:choice-of-anchor D domain-containing protein [Deltaproteobacteria bacterium]